MPQTGEKDFLKTFIDALPSSVFVVEKDFKICEMNKEARKLFEVDADAVVEELCGIIVNCRHALLSKSGCGTTSSCPKCVIRNSVDLAAGGEATYKKRAELQVLKDGVNKVSHILVSASEIEINNVKRVLLVIEDITEMTLLKKMLPICSSCKKIRNDENYWGEVSDYLSSHTNIEFTHSICPDCAKKLYPDLKL